MFGHVALLLRFTLRTQIPRRQQEYSANTVMILCFERKPERTIIWRIQHDEAAEATYLSSVPRKHKKTKDVYTARIKLGSVGACGRPPRRTRMMVNTQKRQKFNFFKKSLKTAIANEIPRRGAKMGVSRSAPLLGSSVGLCVFYTRKKRPNYRATARRDRRTPTPPPSREASAGGTLPPSN